MIQSAMMFALGALLSGLAWLAFSILLVRRTRRLTERQLRASISTSRAEFETERDEMRARHALEIYRQEREVSRGLDMATAYRLEADIAARDLAVANAELQAREEDMHELQQRLAVERDLVQDLERRHAEAGTMLRAVQHALSLEVHRRTLAQEALQEAATAAERRRLELSAVRAQNEALRNLVGDRMPVDEHGTPLLNLIPELEPDGPARTAAPRPAAAEIVIGAGEPSQGGSVVALPTRPRQPAAAASEESAALVAQAARDLERLAAENQDAANPAPRAPGTSEPRMPLASDLAASLAAVNLENRRAGASATAQAGNDPESRLSQALAEIRALKRANQAGE